MYKSRITDAALALVADGQSATGKRTTLRTIAADVSFGEKRVPADRLDTGQGLVLVFLKFLADVCVRCYTSCIIRGYTQDGYSERILVPKWVLKDSQMNTSKIIGQYLLPSILLSVLAGNAVAQKRLRPVPLPVTSASAPNASADRADASAGMINDELLPPADVLHDRHHQVKLDGSGAFTGKLRMPAQNGLSHPAANIQVRIIKHGIVLKTATTNNEGVFSFAGLPEGVVGLLGTSRDSLLLFSLRLVRDEFDGAEQGAFELDFESSVISGVNLPIAKQLIMERLPPPDKRFSETTSKSEGAYEFGTGSSSTSTHGHPVRLQPDGSLVGQVNVLDTRTGMHREIVDLTLHFLRDGKKVAGTKVEATGRFSVSGLSSGLYGVVTTGDDGVLALGIEVVDAPPALANGLGEYRLTSSAESLELVVATVNAENFNRSNAYRISNGEFSPSPDESFAGGPVPGGVPGQFGPGGGGGGMFGGGGGGSVGGGVGGGGGLGALLGAAAAGAIGYLAGDDDDSASPAR